MNIKEFRSRVKSSRAKCNSGAAALVHAVHSSYNAEGKLPTAAYFTNRASAIARSGHGGTGTLVTAFLDIRKPLFLRSGSDIHGVVSLSELIDRSHPDLPRTSPEVSSIFHSQGDAPARVALSVALKLRGYDGLCIHTHHEGFVREAWVPGSSSQVLVLNAQPVGVSRDPWSLTIDEFTGPYIISSVFEIDGQDENYDHLWEAFQIEGEYLPVVKRDSEGWSARWLDDWDPPGTMGLFDPSGEAQGFYMSGMAWINPAARGAGRSRLMILAAAEILGGSPCSNVKGLGFSVAGYQAHVRALDQAKQLAISKNLIRLEDTLPGSGPSHYM